MWNKRTREIAAVFSASTSQITCLAFSPYGATLAVGAEDSRVWLWDVASGQELVSLTGHTEWIQGVAFSPDGAIVATSAEAVRLWGLTP